MLFRAKIEKITKKTKWETPNFSKTQPTATCSNDPCKTHARQKNSLTWNCCRRRYKNFWKNFLKISRFALTFQFYLYHNKL
jgi:hypothetical protein